MAFSRVGSIALDAGDSTIYWSAIDTTSRVAYLAGDHDKIVKVDLATFARVGTYTVASVTKSRGLLFIGTYLYALFTDSSSNIIIEKIDSSSFTESSRQSYGVSFTENTYLYFRNLDIVQLQIIYI